MEGDRGWKGMEGDRGGDGEEGMEGGWRGRRRKKRKKRKRRWILGPWLMFRLYPRDEEFAQPFDMALGLNPPPPPPVWRHGFSLDTMFFKSSFLFIPYPACMSVPVPVPDDSP